MKKLFAILLSFQLIISPLAIAADENETTGTGSKGGYDFYVNQILVLATSAVGTNIMTKCPLHIKTPSILIYMSGSIVHMLSEVLSAKSTNENHQKRMSELKIKQKELDVKGDVAQKEILEERLKEEEATLKFLNNRKMWMTAVAVIHLTAMGFAISEAIPPMTPVFTAPCTPEKSGIKWDKALTLAYGFGNSKLGASGGQITQYGTMLISLLGTFTKVTDKAVGKLYSAPVPRAITFGATGVLSGLVATGLYTRAGKAKQNISNIKKVIAQFKPDTEGVEVAKNPGEGNDDENDPSGKNNPNSPAYKAGKLKDLIVDRKKECLSTSGSDFVVSNSGCSKPVKVPKPIGLANFNLPTMNKVNTLSGNLAQALANGDEALATSIAGEIGSYAAKIKEETDALKVDYNKKQKEKGLPTTDFDKSIKDQVASLQGSMNQAASAGNINLASLGPAAGEASEDKEATPTNPEDIKVTSIATPAAEMPADATFSDGAVEELPIDEATAKVAEPTLDDFESPVQDVSKKKEASIFKQVSDRYILNYNKMFENKKRPEIAPEPPKD